MHVIEVFVIRSHLARKGASLGRSCLRVAVQLRDSAAAGRPEWRGVDCTRGPTQSRARAERWQGNPAGCCSPPPTPAGQHCARSTEVERFVLPDAPRPYLSRPGSRVDPGHPLPGFSPCLLHSGEYLPRTKEFCPVLSPLPFHAQHSPAPPADPGLLQLRHLGLPYPALPGARGQRIRCSTWGPTRTRPSLQAHPRAEGGCGERLKPVPRGEPAAGGVSAPRDWASAVAPARGRWRLEEQTWKMAVGRRGQGAAGVF